MTACLVLGVINQLNVNHRYHAEVDGSPKAAQPGVFSSSYVTVSCLVYR